MKVDAEFRIVCIVTASCVIRLARICDLPAALVQSDISVVEIYLVSSCASRAMCFGFRSEVMVYTDEECREERQKRETERIR